MAATWLTADWRTQMPIVQELAGLSARDLGLAGLVALAVSMIFLGWLVPYRLVRRSDYERVMTLLEEAQATNAANAETMRVTADKKDLATAIVEQMRKEGHHQRGATQEEQP